MRRKKWIFIVPAAILGILLFSFIGGEIVKQLWNWLLPPLFGFREITFWQALGTAGAVPDPLRRPRLSLPFPAPHAGGARTIPQSCAGALRLQPIDGRQPDAMTRPIRTLRISSGP